MAHQGWINMLQLVLGEAPPELCQGHETNFGVAERRGASKLCGIADNAWGAHAPPDFMAASMDA